MKSLKQFQAEAKECCKKCGSYEHITTKCTKTKKEEVEIDERTLSSHIPSDRQGEASAANREYVKAQLKKKKDQSTKNRGDLSKRDAGKMSRERLHNKRIMKMGEEVELEEALSPQDQTKLKNQKRFAQKRLQMDRQKMQLKKAGKLNVNHEEKEKGLDGKACWKGYAKRGTKQKGGKTVDNCVKVESDQIDELNRYEKETGKSSGSLNMPKGRPTKKGGDSSPVMRAVRTSIRRETGKPHGQKKKTKGEKGNRQYGDRKTTPADTIAKRRQSRKDAEKLMRDTSGT